MYYSTDLFIKWWRKVLGIVIVARDVTKQKQAALYTWSILEASLDPLVTINAEGQITDGNHALMNVTGIQRENLIGTDFSIYFTEPERARQAYIQVFEKLCLYFNNKTFKRKTNRCIIQCVCL
jgi:PAS domain-containing protein